MLPEFFFLTVSKRSRIGPNRANPGPSEIDRLNNELGAENL